VVWQRRVASDSVVKKQHWVKSSTLSGYHDRTIFSVDWSPHGLIATGSADDGIRVFRQTGQGELSSAFNDAAAVGTATEGKSDGKTPTSSSSSSVNKSKKAMVVGDEEYYLACRRQSAHDADINCVAW
jgi:WD40 repeat protein